MHILWGILIIIAGGLLLAGASKKSNFIIYRLIYARSKILWGENTYRFHQATGVMVIIFGIFMASGAF